MRRFIVCLLTIGLLSGSASAKEKSPKTAFFLSLVMPGLGELYAGAKWRAAGFMTAEALTWTAYFSWRSKGSDLRTKFRAFAEQHWRESQYRAWQTYNYAQPQSQQYYETENLPPVTQDAQQHYELIGKYDQFVFGWDDVTVPFTTDLASVQSPLRENYETQRNRSNKYLKRAGVVIGLAVFDRIVSAIHASAYAHGHQANEQRLWIDITPMDAYGRADVELKTRF